MSLYYHPTLGVKSIDEALYNEWVLSGNQKAAQYTPIADPPDQYAAFDGEAWVYPPGYSPEERQAAYLDGLACTALQAELELIERNLWPTVNLWIDQQDAVTQAFFRRAQTWQYRDERLQAGATALGMSDADLIEILTAARLR